jgi:hypothetical protein
MRTFATGGIMTRMRGNNIFRRTITLLLALAVLSLGSVPVIAKSSQSPDPSAIEAKVKKLGVGEHVMVKLVTGEKLHGHIMSINGHSFSLQPDTAPSQTEIAFRQVAKIKKNPGPIVWMLIGGLIAVIVIAATR